MSWRGGGAKSGAGFALRWMEEQLKRGLVDWPAVQAGLRERGVVLVGGGLDRAPEVYRRLAGCWPRTRDRFAWATGYAGSAFRHGRPRRTRPVP